MFVGREAGSLHRQTPSPSRTECLVIRFRSSLGPKTRRSPRRDSAGESTPDNRSLQSSAHPSARSLVPAVAPLALSCSTVVTETLVVGYLVGAVVRCVVVAVLVCHGVRRSDARRRLVGVAHFGSR